VCECGEGEREERRGTGFPQKKEEDNATVETSSSLLNPKSGYPLQQNNQPTRTCEQQPRLIIYVPMTTGPK